MDDSMTDFDPAPYLPLTPVAFEVLVSLVEAPRHGYAIMQEIEGRGALRIRPGTLYRAINRLLTTGMIQEEEGRHEPDDDQRRRYYGLTKRGRMVTVAEAERLAAQVATARAKQLLGRRP